MVDVATPFSCSTAWLSEVNERPPNVNYRSYLNLLEFLTRNTPIPASGRYGPREVMGATWTLSGRR